jgi:hypothetical protein
MSRSHPSHPPLPSSVRAAIPSDVPRIGALLVASFYYSPITTYARPYHAQYPQDTLAWYTNQARKYILDPRYVVLVAIDQFDPLEGKKTGAKGLEDVPNGEDAEGNVAVAAGVWDVGTERGGAWRNGEGRVLEGSAGEWARRGSRGEWREERVDGADGRC